MTDDNLQEFITEVERDLLVHIIFNMRQRKITIDQAQQLAKDFLAFLPPSDKKDLLAKLQFLAKKYPEAREVYVDVATEEHEKETKQKLDLMAQHIQSGDIEKAIEVAKT